MNQIFKQAWHQAKTNPVYTSLYIAGVTLTILFVMVIGMVLYIKIAPVYPEENRSTTLYISRHRVDTGDGSSFMSGVGKGAYENLYSKLKNVKNVALVQSYTEKEKISDPTGNKTFKVCILEVSRQFWDIYDFDFLAGKRFSEDTYQLEEPLEIVITDDLATRYFGSNDKAVGGFIKIKDKEYKVKGVVRSASYLTSSSYADIYRPVGKYVAKPGSVMPQVFLGGYQIILNTENGEQTEALTNEISEMVNKLNTSGENKGRDGEEFKLNIGSQPIPHWKSVLLPKDSGEDSLKVVIWLLAVIVMALLIVPAINLSGLIGGRMDTRLSELGIRKSYGATSRSLLKQVLFENFLLTSVGAFLGMIGAWILIVTCRRWIFSIFDTDPYPIEDWISVDVNGDMMFAPMLFLMLLVVCFTVNLLSAFFPAWVYMRKPIVSSLYEKR